MKYKFIANSIALHLKKAYRKFLTYHKVIKVMIQKIVQNQHVLQIQINKGYKT